MGIGEGCASGSNSIPPTSQSGELRIAAAPSITVRPHRHICGLNAKGGRVGGMRVRPVSASELSCGRVSPTRQGVKKVECAHGLRFTSPRCACFQQTAGLVYRSTRGPQPSHPSGGKAPLAHPRFGCKEWTRDCQRAGEEHLLFGAPARVIQG